MTDKPIIFSAPMVRALLEGRKTQTRRILKPQPDDLVEGQLPSSLRVQICDRLWVRENVRGEEIADGTDGVRYLADSQWLPIQNTTQAADRWVELFNYGRRRGATVPSIHMPRWASRLTLTVTDVRVERLQEISTADCIAEGAIDDEWREWREDAANVGLPEGGRIENERDAYERLWISINGWDSWHANPWVAAYTFTVEQRNIDR